MRSGHRGCGCCGFRQGQQGLLRQNVQGAHGHRGHHIWLLRRCQRMVAATTSAEHHSGQRATTCTRRTTAVAHATPSHTPS